MALPNPQFKGVLCLEGNMEFHYNSRAMSRIIDKLHSKYLGAILGAAAGDALAFPLRNYSRNFLASLAQPLATELQITEDGFSPLGQNTGDIQGCLAVIHSILERGDLKAEEASARIFVEHLIPLWRDMSVVDPAEDNSTVMNMIVRGITEWDAAALPPGEAGSGCLTRAIPIGLWNCKNPGNIPAQVETLVSVSHQDTRVLAAAAVIATLIAYNVRQEELVLGDIMDETSAAAASFDKRIADAICDLPRILSQTDPRALEMILEICPDDDYPPRRDGLTDYAVPILFLSLRQFLNNPQSFHEALDRILRLGGNMSTIASISGAFCGSYLGIEEIPENLVDKLLEKEEILRQTNKLFELRRNMKRKEIHASESKKEPASQPEDPDSETIATETNGTDPNLR